MAGVTTTSNYTVNPREVDFVNRFNLQWEAMMALYGIMNPIEKAPGTILRTYTASMVDDALATSPAEGVDITFTQFQVVEATKSDLTLEKYGKAVTAESVAKYGADIAVQKTDEQFLIELQNQVLTTWYTNLNDTTSKMVGTQTTWQKALAIAKGAVLNAHAANDLTVTEVVGFANIMDAYGYLGTANITVQTAFGIQYVENFMGYKTLFLLPAKYIAAGRVIAIARENLDLYYIDPSNSEFNSLGLTYTVEGETNLLGFHVEGNYRNVTGEAYALMGMALWYEREDCVAVVTVGDSDVTPAVA